MASVNRKIRAYFQQIANLRQELAALDEKRMQSREEEQPKFSQRIVEIGLEMGSLENRIRQENRQAVNLINELRQEVISALEQFNQWRQKMREMEKLFLVNFVRPGFILKQAVRQREYLETALMQLRTRITNREFHSLSDLENEIQKVLSHAEHGFQADQRSFEDEAVQQEGFWKLIQEIDPQQIVEGINEDQIARDFKRIVLPAVHPDTSETPVDIFLTVKEVYEENDYLLMEAYVAQYRGEMSVDEETDSLEWQDLLEKREREYQSLSSRLQRRLRALKKEMTPAELDDPEKVEGLLHQQRDEIRDLIQVETEKIFTLRKLIMELVQLFLELHRGQTDA